jgi:tetratricopeptide (TPR) repeat protein
MPLTLGFSSKKRRAQLFLVFALVIFGIAVLGWAVANLFNSADSSTTTGAAAFPSAEQQIAMYQSKLAQVPGNSYFLAQLGLAYLQQVRETADAATYLQAEAAFNEALKHDPQQIDALVGQGVLALARHDFIGALEWAEQARVANPFRSDVLGIMVDAQVELGRYEEAVASAQQMVDMKPGLASYSRVSYIRELDGDVPGAIEAMQAAAEAGLPGEEGTLWAMYQLGTLYFNAGEWGRAAAVYENALQFRPNYPYALAGIARVEAAEGNYSAAAAILEPLAARLPLPQFVVLLGDVYWRTGQFEKAQQQYDLVRVIQQLNAGSGMNVDLELALFEADYGDPAAALTQAQAAYEARPSIYAADVLAWALYQNGRYEEAYTYSQEGLRLGTRDAMLFFHAGMIARELGKTAEAEQYLNEALAVNPAFSLKYGETAVELTR